MVWGNYIILLLYNIIEEFIATYFTNDKKDCASINNDNHSWHISEGEESKLNFF